MKLRELLKSWQDHEFVELFFQCYKLYTVCKSEHITIMSGKLENKYRHTLKYECEFKNL